MPTEELKQHDWKRSFSFQLKVHPHTTLEKEKRKWNITRANYGNENLYNRPFSPLLNQRPLSERKNRKGIGKHGKKDRKTVEKTENMKTENMKTEN